MPLRPCLDCGRLTQGTRCAEHMRTKQRQRDQRRGTFTERGYTAEFTRARRILTPKAIGQPCPLCSRPMCKGSIDLDHIVPLSKGGTNALANLRPVCSPCNRGRST